MAQEEVVSNTMVDESITGTGTEAITGTGTEAITVTGTVAITVTGTEATNETEDEQHETQRRHLEKTAKLLCGVALNLSVAIIIAIVANTNKSGSRSHRELIVFKASATLALLTFFAGLGLLISVQYKNVKRIVQLGLIIIAIITILAGVVGLAMNIVF